MRPPDPGKIGIIRGEGLLSNIWRIINNLMSHLYIPKIQVIDVVEILIIAVLLYAFFNWIKSTRAYNLLKGILVIGVFVLIAALLQMTTILWLMNFIAPSALMALVIIFQPELRRALEKLGQQSLIASFIPHITDREDDLYFSDATVNEIVRASSEMASARTGALIVMEQNVRLEEYIQTGIRIDANVSSQLLLNIFEHNTPLHDGAVILRGDRIVSATSYLPLSDSEAINKRFGTRHRAGVGVSEVSDSFTIIVSEETGRISYAMGGKLTTGVSISELREKLYEIQKKHRKRDRINKIWKRRDKDEDKTVS